jgi:hypothetical protein
MKNREAAFFGLAFIRKREDDLLTIEQQENEQ